MGKKSDQYRKVIDGGFIGVTAVALIIAYATYVVRGSVYDAALLFGIIHNKLTNALIWIMSRGVTLATAALEERYGYLLED